jgi:hypothetical protein
MPGSLFNSSTTPKHGYSSRSRSRSPSPQPIYYPVPLIDLPIRTSTKLARNNANVPGFRLLRRFSKSCLKIVNGSATTDANDNEEKHKGRQEAEKREEVVKRKFGGDVELSKVRVRVTEKRGSESTEEDGNGQKSGEKKVWEIRKIWTAKRPRDTKDGNCDGERRVREIRSNEQNAESHRGSNAKKSELQQTVQHKKQSQTIRHSAWKRWWKQLLFEELEPDTYWKPLPPDPPSEDLILPTKQRIGQVVLKEKKGVPIISCVPTAGVPQFHHSSWPLNPPSLSAEDDVGSTTEATEIAKSLTRAINRTPSLIKKEKGVQKLRAQATDVGIEGKRRVVEGENVRREETTRRDGNEKEGRRRKDKQIRKEVRRHMRSKSLNAAPTTNKRGRPPPTRTIPQIKVITCEHEDKKDEQTKGEVQRHIRSKFLNAASTTTPKNQAPPAKSRPKLEAITRVQKDKQDKQIKKEAQTHPRSKSLTNLTTSEPAQRQAHAEQLVHGNTLVDELVSAIDQHIRSTEQRLTILSPTMEYDELTSSPGTGSVKAVRTMQSWRERECIE